LVIEKLREKNAQRHPVLTRLTDTGIEKP